MLKVSFVESDSDDSTVHVSDPEDLLSSDISFEILEVRPASLRTVRLC